VHDLMTDPAFSAVNRRVALALSRRVRLVGVNSAATGAAFVAVGGRADRVRVVPNGFDADVAEPGPEASRDLRELAGLDERPVVGLFGRLAPWKGQEVLLRALSAMPDVQAVLVGGPLFGAEEFERELRTLADELGISDRVRFLGHREDVPTLMAGVDVVVHCSTTPEPFGRVLVEAQLARRPVVATDGGGVREIVTDEVDGLVVAPRDVDALTAAVARVLADPALAARMGAAGRAGSSGRYALTATRETFAALIDEVVGGSD
jgi:glycosyltransferase involved in cell wall biosynthesis